MPYLIDLTSSKGVLLSVQSLIILSLHREKKKTWSAIHLALLNPNGALTPGCLYLGEQGTCNTAPSKTGPDFSNWELVHQQDGGYRQTRAKLHPNPSSWETPSDSIQICLLKAPGLLGDNPSHGRVTERAQLCTSVHCWLPEHCIFSRYHTRYHVRRTYPHCSAGYFLVGAAFLKSLLHTKNIFLCMIQKHAIVIEGRQGVCPALFSFISTSCCTKHKRFRNHGKNILLNGPMVYWEGRKFITINDSLSAEAFSWMNCVLCYYVPVTIN